MTFFNAFLLLTLLLLLASAVWLGVIGWLCFKVWRREVRWLKQRGK